MSPEAKAFILSEQFIHEALAKRAHAAYERAVAIWGEDMHLTPAALFWPTDVVLTREGAPYEGVIMAALPELTERHTFFAEAIKRITPYGIFTVEVAAQQGGACLIGLFETSHGARQWLRPLHQHGDVLVVGPEVVTNNRHHLGVLWSPARGSA